MRRLLCVLLGTVLLAGCAGELTEEDRRAASEYGSHGAAGGHHGSTTGSAPSLPTRPYTWAQLAERTGCTATLQGPAKDFRQAACDLGGDTFVFLDFDTEDGKEAWLEYALLYGGVYLVGERWVLSGRSAEYMRDTLLPRLGGTIQQGGHGTS